MTTQRAMWSRIAILEESIQRANRTRRKKKSEKRQRTERVTVRLLPSELDTLDNIADLLQISRAELLRQSALDCARSFEYHLRKEGR